MGFSIGARLLASQLDTFTPAGDVVAGGKVQATTAQAASDTQVTNGTTTSTSYTATLTGGTACGVSFVAPPTGAVLIHFSLGLFNSAANFTNCTIRVRTGSTIGSGSDVVAASDDNAILVNGTNLDQKGRAIPVTGLTPGASYNVQTLHRVSAGTGNFQRKILTVVPQF